MSIRIVEYDEARIPSVQAFNARLRNGGITLQFHESCVPHHLPKLPDRRLFEEHFLAIDDSETVRGAYGLKHQDFWVAGKTIPIADLWLPISEGAFDKSYASLAPALLKDALRRQPMLYGLGMGGYDRPLVRILAALGWRMFSVPFYFRPLHPFAFLRNIAFLRKGRLKTAVLDAMAYTGLGWLAIKGLQTALYRAAAREPSVCIEEVSGFSDWADRLWESCRDNYEFSAVRDAATLKLLYPEGKPGLIYARVMRASQCIGWTVLCLSQLSGHKHFGGMRMGTLVDCMALPADARHVVAAAVGLLKDRGADLVVSNQSHAAWTRALKSAGFFSGPSNFIFASSPKLTGLLQDSKIADKDIHINRGDGDGPIHL